MNVTKGEDKYRQLQIEDYLQMVSPEEKEYVGVYSHIRITETENTNTDCQTDSLLEKILNPNNLNEAYKRVKKNKGAGGVDGMNVDELLTFLKNNKSTLLQKIREGKYKPNPVRRVEIPKENKGEFRKLGIPTVVDRVIQQAITGVLTPIYEKQFKETSYGFRPNRSAHDALKKCQEYADEGYVYVVDMDLEKFFDTVCQSKLIEILGRTIKDGRVISLIHKYLNAGVINHGLFEKTEKGMPQGGPLSPLLSNIMLNELDKEVEARGHKFVRYADDCMIFCRSKKSANRTLDKIVPYIEKKLFLKVNTEKTKVAHISKVKYLGYGFRRYNKKCRLTVHPKTEKKMRNKIRELTNRNNGWSNEMRAERMTQYVRGWVNYFRLADMKSLNKRTDMWMRHRIRAVYWKQWKKVKTRYRKLRSLGVSEEWIYTCANLRQGIWKSSGLEQINYAINNKVLKDWGYPTFQEYYLKFSVN